MSAPKTPHPDWNPERQAWVYPLRTSAPVWREVKRRRLVAYIAVEFIEEDTDQDETPEAGR